MSAQSYPLQWPESWPRTPDHRRSTRSQFNTTFDLARSELMKELRLLGATNVVVSSWLPLRRDGMPYSDQARRRLDDPGVAVYFLLRKRQMVMARDAYTSVHDNLRSIGLGIAHLRGLERHGGGTMMERAFAGFVALPPAGNGGSRPWWDVLGISRDAGTASIREAHRRMLMEHHPDRGGSSVIMAEANAARDAALKERGQ